MSSDGGETWNRISEDLPEAPVRAVTVHPKRNNWIYAGTEFGLFASENFGQTWSVINEGPANVSIEDLIWKEEELYCVTYGRGVFKIDLSTKPLFDGPRVTDSIVTGGATAQLGRLHSASFKTVDRLSRNTSVEKLEQIKAVRLAGNAVSCNFSFNDNEDCWEFETDWHVI